MRLISRALPISAIAPILLLACQEGDPKAIEEREYARLTPFDSVSFETYGQMEIAQGDREYLFISAPPATLRRMRVETVDGVLRVGYRGLFKMRGPAPKIRLGLVRLSGIRAASGGDIRAAGVSTQELYIESSSSGSILLGSLTAARARIRSSSSGTVTIDGARVGKLEAIASSRGDISVKGEAEELEYDGSSSGSLEGGELKATKAAIWLSSSGEATIWVTERLDARLSSKGNLRYYGEPAMGARSARGSGDLVALGRKEGR